MADQEPETNIDLSPLRIAIEHLTSHQNIPLEQAAACMASFAAMLAYDRLGIEKARAVIHCAMSEVATLAVHDPDLKLPDDGN